jgi:glycosyltransferase involved in cell wall biosynthesis
MGYYGYLNFLQLFELWLFMLAGKRIFMTYQGDDARQGDFLRNHFEINIATEVDDDYYTSLSDKWKRKSIDRLSYHCSQIYALNPDLLYVLPAKSKFLPYANIKLEDWPYSPPQLDENISLKICHAPSNRDVKGTNFILSVVNQLRAEGYALDLILIEGLSNNEAKKQYQKADIFIDQLFAGWYGGVAVEAMALGKPVLSYIREDDLKFISLDMRNDLPIVNVNAECLYSEIKRFIEMPRTELALASLQARAFVEKWHDPVKIAKEIKQDYEASISHKVF